MKFKHSCFIENTEAAREHLRKIGYLESLATDPNGDYLKTQLNSMYYAYNTQRIGQPWDCNIIDCTGNLPLFKALTAVRDDSDYMQWFVADCFLDFSKGSKEECYSTGELFLCKEKEVKDLKFNWLRLPTYVPVPFFHRATKEELIEQYRESYCSINHLYPIYHN